MEYKKKQSEAQKPKEQTQKIKRGRPKKPEKEKLTNKMMIEKSYLKKAEMFGFTIDGNHANHFKCPFCQKSLKLGDQIVEHHKKCSKKKEQKKCGNCATLSKY